MMYPHSRPASACHELPSPEALKAKLAALPSTHMVRVLYAEHDRILAMLSEMGELVTRMQTSAELGSNGIARIHELAHLLIEAEPHHQREEDVLFPELEKQGLNGPPQAMSAEHVELRRLKHEIHDISASAVLDAGAKQQLARAARTLVNNLQLHIHKENEILYPLALSVITGDDAWNRLNAAADAIGPCPF
ncbi:MAG: hemerythrin domain-containing protein [Deltaproteobacteria bacterium]|nr:hemerythrin domain-containing protein [Deltaproteobacteria bacterium]